MSRSPTETRTEMWMARLSEGCAKLQVKPYSITRLYSRAVRGSEYPRPVRVCAAPWRMGH